MRLCDAIKQTIRLLGRDVVVQKTFVPAIADYQGFEEGTALKKMLMALQDGGYAQKLLALRKTDTDLDVQLKACMASLIKDNGFQEDLARYTIFCVAYGLGLVTKAKVPHVIGEQASKLEPPKKRKTSRPKPKPKLTPKPSSTPRPTPKPKTKLTTKPYTQTPQKTNLSMRLGCILEFIEFIVNGLKGIVRALFKTLAFPWRLPFSLVKSRGLLFYAFLLPVFFVLGVNLLPFFFIYSLFKESGGFILSVAALLFLGSSVKSCLDLTKKPNAGRGTTKTEQHKSGKNADKTAATDSLVQGVYADVKAGDLKEAERKLKSIPSFIDVLSEQQCSDTLKITFKDYDAYNHKYDPCFLAVINAYIGKEDWDAAQDVGLLFKEKNKEAWSESLCYKKLKETAKKKHWEWTRAQLYDAEK